MRTRLRLLRNIIKLLDIIWNYRNIIKNDKNFAIFAGSFFICWKGGRKSAAWGERRCCKGSGTELTAVVNDEYWRIGSKTELSSENAPNVSRTCGEVGI